jgi:HK97 family phage portal protein
VKLPFGLVVTRAAPGLQPVPTNRGGWYPFVREPFTGAWQRNQEWTTETVLAHHAVYACITRIAQDFGKLRSMLIERDKSGIGSEITNTSHSPVLRSPNRFQNPNQFKECWAISKLIHGNTYVLMERDGREVPSAMYILDPTRVTVLVAPDGTVFYQLKQDNLSSLEENEIVIPASEIIHDRINCLYHPLVGTSPIFASGQAANMGIQIETNSTAFFGNGSNPSGILSTAVTITPEKSEQLSALWNARFGKDKSGGVAVLGDGMKFEAMRMTGRDSQLIEQLRWTAETVCSTFHVPPWKIGIGEQPAYTKPEIANQAYYSDCLQAHIEHFEACMNRAFGFETPTEGRMLSVELDLDGLLRMDAASQMDLLVKASGGAVLTPDEARARADLGPLPGGDTLYRQQQEHSLEALAKRDEKPDPFGTTAPPSSALPPPEPQKALPAGEAEEATRSWDDLPAWPDSFWRDARETDENRENVMLSP